MLDPLTDLPETSWIMNQERCETRRLGKSFPIKEIWCLLLEIEV